MSVLVCGRVCLSGTVPEGLRYSRFSGASKASALPERQNTQKLRANDVPAGGRQAPGDRSRRPRGSGDAAHKRLPGKKPVD